MRTPLTAAVLALSTLGFTSCHPAPKACTEIGAESGVMVDATARADRLPEGLQVCAGDECTSARQEGAEPFYVAPMTTLTSTDPVEVTVSSDGETLLRQTVAPTKVQPNGPECEPTAYQVRVTLPR